MLLSGYNETQMGSAPLNIRPDGRLTRWGQAGQRKGLWEGVLEFVREPLPVPSVMRPEEERLVLYVRLAAARASSSRVMAVLPNAGAVVARSLRAADLEGEPIERAVIVGVDALFVPQARLAPGYEDALTAFVDVLRAFTDASVPFVWRTRGGVGEGGMPHLVANALVAAGRLATVEIGIATLEDELARALEGGAGAPAQERLRLATALASRGVHVRALLDPLVPMLTDQQAPLEALVQSLAEAGVHRLGARYIVLTRERAKVIAQRLGGMQRALLQGVFAEEPWRIPDEGGPRELHKRIPAPLRRRGHHRLRDLAERFGVIVDILDPVLDAEFDSLAPQGVESRSSGQSGGQSGGAGHAASRHKPRPARIKPQLDLFKNGR